MINETNISCAKKTLEKYYTYQEILQDGYDIFTDECIEALYEAGMNDFGSASSCAYCNKFYSSETDPKGKWVLDCSDCPIAMATGITSCMNYPEFYTMNDMFQEGNSFDKQVFKEALETRIQFHEDIINNGGYVPQTQIDRYENECV